jgi:cystathionine beta-lyase/cystathionine gamma-synthase
MCGFVAGDAVIIRRIRDVQVLLGNVLDPHAAWLALRGIKTLALRVQRQSDNALSIARFLESCAGVRAVHHPYLGSSPCFEITRRQMRCGGGVVSFEVDGGQRGARAFLDALELIPVATSLGGVETIIEIPHDLDFGPDLPGSGCGGGISPGLIRLSVGIENAGDLIRDLRRGVRALNGSATG